MYYYDAETGEMEFTRDPERARRSHIIVMIGASSYGLSPESVGQLFRVLGPAPIEVSRAEAVRRVQRALATLGLSHLRVEDVASALGQEWQLLLKIGD